MADLLTHVLVPYVLLTVLGWFVGVPRRWTPVAMGGAVLPDLVKVGSVVDRVVVQEALGLPFSYAPVSSVGGVLVTAAGVTVLFERTAWARVYGLLVFGGGVSLVVDGARVFVDGAAGYWLYPVWIRPPTPSLYVTSDYRVTITAVAVAGVVALLDGSSVTDSAPARSSDG